MPDAEPVIFFDPTSETARAMWQTSKAKHAAAIKAKKITFAEDLGPLLDKRSAHWTVLNKIDVAKKAAVQKQKMKQAARAGIDQALNEQQWAMEQKQYQTQLAGFAKSTRAELKALQGNAVLLEQAAAGYKLKILALANPSKKELNETLDFVIGRAHSDLKAAARAQ